MKKKEEWMKKGAMCLCQGTPAIISRFQENKGLGMVYYFWIKFIEGTGKVIGPYHPSDIEEYNPQQL